MHSRNALSPFSQPLALAYSLLPSYSLLSSTHVRTHGTLESGDYSQSNAADGNEGTRWSSNQNENNWLKGDGQIPRKVEQVAILWESAYCAEYAIQYSHDDR